MSLDSTLKAHFRSDAWKQKSRAELIAQAKSGKGGFASGLSHGVLTADDARLKVEEIVAALQKALPDSIRESISLADFQYTVPSQPDRDGFFHVDITLNPKAVHRESLYDEGYPDGLQNIVQYLSTGQKASRNWVSGAYRPSGSWQSANGKTHHLLYRWYYIPAGYTRAGDPFWRDAVDKLNRQLRKENIKVTLSETYYT